MSYPPSVCLLATNPRVHTLISAKSNDLYSVVTSALDSKSKYDLPCWIGPECSLFAKIRSQTAPMSCVAEVETCVQELKPPFLLCLQ